jgi:glycosyltransferase involved in cell wall biosynthesis
MSARMKALGAREVMTFPFGLESLPKQGAKKQPWLFFANRGLEPLYRPERVLRAFAAVAAVQPQARLIVANDGSLRAALEQQARELGLDERIEFVGRLDARTQAGCYAKARWYLSLPQSDSVSVSVLEAMAHECLPILSELPANRELLLPGGGLILAEGKEGALPELLQPLLSGADAAGATNRAWVAAHGLFAPAVENFLNRLQSLDKARSR